MKENMFHDVISPIIYFIYRMSPDLPFLKTHEHESPGL